MAWKTLDAMDLDGKVVLTRVDINVPVEARPRHRRDPHRADRPDREGHPRQGRQAGPHGAFRPPQGQAGSGDEPRRSAAGAGGRARPPCRFRGGLHGSRPKIAVAALAQGGVLLLENLRFHPGEEKNDPAIRRGARGAGRRLRATTPSRPRTGRTPPPKASRKLLPSCAGRLMEAELEALEKALDLAGAASGRRGRRRQGLHQARTARQPHRQGRPDRHRRRHGQHLPRGPGRRCRQVALRARHGGRRARDHGRRRTTAGCELVLPLDVVVAREFKADAAARDRPGLGLPVRTR